MKFDRKAPGEGVEAVCRLERGRVVIEWSFFYLNIQEETGYILSLTMRDKEGQTALLCMQEAQEEEPLVSVILHPQLWSCQRPYLYEVEAVLQSPAGTETDRLKKQLPLRELSFQPRRGWLLNGSEFVLKAVEYTIPQHTSQTQKQQLVLKDFRLLREMGANCVRVEPSLWKLCDRLGFLIWQRDMAAVGEELPCLTGEETDRPASRQTCSLFYQYKARWSDEPFVYIAPEGVLVLPSGNLQVTVYSNCSRVVLFSDGTLFEFQSGSGKFIFQEVPAKHPCVTLSAEGDDCSMSLSFHKTFARLMKENY